MTDLDRPYNTPMDKMYHGDIQRNERRTEVEEPIFPISLIGQTVPEVDPTGRYRNIVEGVDAAFRAGSGNIQLVMQVPGQLQPIGGGPKAYGEDVRQALREVQMAAGAKIRGVELPTQVNNLTGFTQQGFNEEQRKIALDEVKDAIKFIGDISGGGGVDIVSFEFPRNIRDAKWYNEEKEKGFDFKQREKEIAMLVDKETGKVAPFDKTDTYYLFYDKNTLEPLDVEKLRESGKEYKPAGLNWEQVEKIAKKEGKVPEQFLLEKYQIEKQKEQIEGQMAYYERLIDSEKEHEKAIRTSLEQIQEYKKQGIDLKRIRSDEEQIKKQIKEAEDSKNMQMKAALSQELRMLHQAQDMLENEELLRRQEKSFPTRVKELQGSINTMKIQREELEDMKRKYKPIADYGVGKAADSYAEAGIFAMQESLKNERVQRGHGSVHVGPEMGWPQFYGSHPKEWVELIKEARGKMIEKLTSQYIEDPISHQKTKNPYYDPSVNQRDAEELAKKHIKGELDTSHLGMWFQSFKTELPWDERLSEFKKWYKNQIDFLAEENKKHDIIGGIQVVDSASGAHGHLPPGQGMLGTDLIDYMKILKEKGNYKGEFISEGHEEEKFGQGRILTETLAAFGSRIGTGSFYGRQMPQFSDIRHAYAGISYGTTGIFQSYVPSNDFSLWSNVPLE